MLQIQNFFCSSGNAQIAVAVYSPTSSIGSKLPGIILCQGFAATKRMLLPAYAERFAQEGYIAITFDYRGFGESDGEPGRLLPKLQIEDIQNVMTFFSSLERVDPDRIGLWGTYYGGANAIVASQDKRVKCLCVQIAFGDGERCITSNMSTEEASRLKETLHKLKEKRDATGKEMMVPISKILSDPQSKDFFEKNVARFPELEIKIPFLTVWETLNYKPEQYLANVSAPILIIGAEHDIVNPVEESRELYKLAAEPKELAIIKGASHFDLYEGEYFEQTISKELTWFKKYL